MTVINVRKQEEPEVETSVSTELPEGVVNVRNHGIDASPTETIIFNGEPTEVTRIDGDTVRLPSGQLLRAKQIDTAETAKVFDDDIIPMDNTLANIEQAVISDYAEQGGYDTITTTGETGHHDRLLYETTNEHGEVLEEKLIEHDIVKPGSWTDDTVVLNRSMNQFKEMMTGMNNAMTPERKAAAVVNYALAHTPFDFERAHGEISRSGWRPVDPVHASDGIYEETMDSLYLGMVRLEHSAAAFTDWFSDVLGADEFGEDWLESTERRISRVDNTNLNDIWDFHGNKFAKDADVGTFLQFFSNTVVEFGPQLAVLYGAGKGGAITGAKVGAVGGPKGAAIGAAVGAFVATTTAAFAMAVGEFYNAMPDDEKDPLVAAGWALPIALVDKIGLSKGALMGVNVLTKEGAETAVSKMVANGMTEEAAKKKLKDSVFEVFQEASIDLRDKTTAQLIAQKGVKDLLIQGAGVMGKEALTEGVQEGIQYYGLTHSTSNVFNSEELLEAMAAGAVIGGIASSPFGVGQVLKDQAQVNQLLYQTREESGERSRDSLIEEELAKEAGGKQSKIEMARDVKAKVNPKNLSGGLGENYSEADKRTIFKDVAGMIRDPVSSLRNWRGNIVAPYLKKGDGSINKSVAKIASLLDYIRVNSGLSVGKQAKNNFDRVHNHIRGLGELYTKAGVKTDEEWISLTKRYNNDPDSLTADQREAIEMNIEDGKAAGKALADLMEAQGVDIGLTRKELEEGWLNKVGYFDPRAIDDGFVDAVAEIEVPGVKGRRGKKLYWGRERAQKLADDIKNNKNQLEVMEQLLELDLLNNPALGKYKSVTGYQAQAKLIQQFTRKIAHEGFFGKNNEVLNKLVHQALEDNEISPEQFRTMSAQLDDWTKALNNEYGQIENAIWRGIQDNMLFVSQMIYMDTNFFANMAELAYGLLRLPYNQYYKFFGKAAKEFALNIRDDISQAGEALTGNRQIGTKRTRRAIDTSAHLTQISDAEILVLEGNNTMSPWRQKMSTMLFKINLVSAQTNGIRAAIGAFGWNEMIKLVDAVVSARQRGYHTDESRYAWDMLGYYGVKQEEMIQAAEFFTNISEDAMQAMDPEHPMYKMLAENYEIAIVNFVDEFSARPEVGSGWKISEDKRFGFFTQFKRFISHFTANQVPHLWKMYIKRGSPQMTYQVFNVIMVSFLMAAVAQYLKDLLKYDEEELEEQERWKNWYNNNVVRGIKYTGWVGTPEMMVDAIVNYNRQTWKSHPERMLDTLLSQAPALNTAWDMLGYDLEDPKDQEKLVGKIPFIGDPSASRNYIHSVLFGNGEK